MAYWEVLLIASIFLLTGAVVVYFCSKRTRRLFLEDDENLRAVFENIQDGFYRADNEGRIIWASPSAVKILGFDSKDEIENSNILDFYANPRDREALIAEMKRNGRILDYEVKLRRRDGQIIVASVSSTFWRDKDNNILGIEGIFRDITDRKKAEVALLESREMTRAIFNTATDGIIVTDLDVKIVEINDAVIKMGGYSDESEIIGKSAFDFVVEEDQEMLREGIEELLATGSMSNRIITIRRKDGSRIKLEIRPAVLRDKDGHAVGFMAIQQDITERLKAEEKLRESEEFSRAVIENSPLGVSVRSRTGRLLSANDSWKKIWAVPEEDLAHDLSRDRESLKFDSRDDYLGEWRPGVERIYKEGGYLHIPELRVSKRREGGAEWVSQHFYAIKNDSGRVDRVVILTEDITSQKRINQELQKSEEFNRAVISRSPLGVSVRTSVGKL